MQETIHSLRLKGFKVKVNHKRRYQVPESIQILPQYLMDGRREVPSIVKLMATGGETRIELRSPEGIEVVGVATCSIKDSFNRKYGNIKALSRALAALSKAK